MDFILASNSPRRKDILEKYLKEFKIETQNISEVINPKYDLLTNSMSISRKKGLGIAIANPNHIILSGDTMVVLDGEVLTKPKNKEEARSFLRKLSGKTHYVISSFYIAKKSMNIELCDYDISEVKFYELSDQVIESYLASNEWVDKAGAYGIQGLGALLIDNIYGDFYSIVGLPIARINQYLYKYFNFNLMGG